MGRGFVIAIDGPSGAGKGTVARALAAELGYQHIDTGVMYRTVAWRAVTLGLALDDEDRLAGLARDLQMELDGSRVFVDGREVTQSVRTAAIDRAASAVARLPRVREALVARQRALGGGAGIVMEGRDIGTVVFPQADVKIFLDASPDERARRRASDPAHAGGETLPVGVIADEMAARDQQDSTRAASPLSVAVDATVVDTTHLSISEVVAAVLAVVRAKQAVS